MVFLLFLVFLRQKKPRRVLLLQDIKPPWFWFRQKKPRKMRGLLTSNLRGLINGLLNNKFHFSCQEKFPEKISMKSFIDDQVEKLYIINVSHEGRWVRKPLSPWLFFMETNRIYGKAEKRDLCGKPVVVIRLGVKNPLGKRVREMNELRGSECKNSTYLNDSISTS